MIVDPPLYKGRIISLFEDIMSIFDIIGPVMVGPSSSHTAGAVKIGLITAKLLGEKPVSAEITLSGSFAATGKGHGTDRALVAGLLGMSPDDDRIPESFEIAKKNWFTVHFNKETIKEAHPNTALLNVTGASGRIISVQACSVGGGRIRVKKIDGVLVDFSAEMPTLIVNNLDKPGCVAEITDCISHEGINIATMQLYRNKRGGEAVMVVELDDKIPDGFAEKIASMEGVTRVVYTGGE